MPVRQPKSPDNGADMGLMGLLMASSKFGQTAQQQRHPTLSGCIHPFPTHFGQKNYIVITYHVYSTYPTQKIRKKRSKAPAGGRTRFCPYLVQPARPQLEVTDNDIFDRSTELFRTYGICHFVMIFLSLELKIHRHPNPSFPIHSIPPPIWCAHGAQ